MKKNNFIYLLISIVLFSCTKEIRYKGEDKDPVLVLNGIQDNDSIFKIYLERSFFFLSSEETNEKYIKSGATVVLTNLSSGETTTLTQSTIDNLYEFPFTVPENTSYKIEVSHPDYKKISASMTTVAKINLISVDTSSYITTDGSLNKKAKIKWQDPVGENYYFLKIGYYDPQYDYSYNVWFSSTDAIFSNNSDAGLEGEYEMEEGVFTDQLFEGKEKEIEVDFYTYVADSVQNNPIYTYELSSVSKETYMYIESVKKKINSSTFLTEPVKVFSNIENGFGIFGSRSTSRITK
jgi:hypothetical protein